MRQQPASDCGGEASGGTAVLARAGHLGLTTAEEHLEQSLRALAAKLDFPGGRRTLVIAAYLRCTIGLKDDNLDLLDSFGAAARSWAGPFVVGADFNADPQAAIASGIEHSMKAKVVAPDAPPGHLQDLDGGPHHRLLHHGQGPCGRTGPRGGG